MPVTKRKSADLDAPIWFDGTNINEALFCDEFLSSRKIIFANGAFFTPDGRVTDDLPLRGEIYEELKCCAVNNIPRKITKGFIIKVREEDGTKRYDFQYNDRYGYTNTIGGISRLFNEEFWNYAKLISGVLRYGMPIEKTVSLIESLHLDSESINTWKTGVCRALKQYIVDGTQAKGKCPQCGQENMAYQNGCLTCMSCGYSKCG